MPEGDTLHNLARVMGPRLIGRRLTRIELSGVPSALSGQRVKDVRAFGKHLLIELESGLVLRSHLGLHGSWHRYAPDEPWRRPERQASIVLRTARDVFVCFNVKSANCIEARKLKVHPVVGRLGPDLLSEHMDLEQVVVRARKLLEPDELMVDVLLNQHVASGIGNVYKSEVLFLCKLDPRTRLGSLVDTRLADVYRRARELMRGNLGRGVRRTTGADREKSPVNRTRYWVYGRAGQPCLKCQGRIEYGRPGKTNRSTYWCPKCQPRCNRQRSPTTSARPGT